MQAMVRTRAVAARPLNCTHYIAAESCSERAAYTSWRSATSSYSPMNKIVHEGELLNGGWRNDEGIEVTLAHRSAYVVHRKNEGKPSIDDLFEAASPIGVK